MNLPRKLMCGFFKAEAESPGFALQNGSSELVSSVDILSNGPQIFSFYRGLWCPYCNIELQALQATLPKFDQANAILVVISPQNLVNNR